MPRKRSHKAAGFQWTETRCVAAALIAEDKLSDAQIASRLKIGRTTLSRWKRDPEFQTKVQESVARVDGMVILTFTPLQGLTELVLRFLPGGTVPLSHAS